MDNLDTIQWKSEMIDVKKLKPLDGNPRSMDIFTFEKLKKSVQRFGQVVPLVVNKDNTVLGGNQRIKVFDGKVLVVKPIQDLNEKQIQKIVLMHNQEIGMFDFLKLDELGFSNDKLEQLGFSDEEINDMRFSVTDFDFSDYDDAKNIKKIIVNFTDYPQARELILSAKEKYDKTDFESVLLKLCEEYENDIA